MLRLIFVLALIILGTVISVWGPFYALLFYLWNAYFRPDYWTYGGFIMSLNLSWIIGVYLVIRTLVSRPQLKINARTLLLGLFLIQAIVGTYTSEDQSWSWSFLQDFARVIVITYLIVVLVNDRKQFRLVVLVIALSLGFEAVKQGWVNLYRAPGAANINPIAFLGDNNGVAVGMFMLLPILGALAQTAKGQWERYLHRFFAIGVLLRGISTYSRGGFLGGAALGIIVLLRAEKKVRTFLLLMTVGIVIWNMMPEGFWSRMGTIQVEEGEARDESAAGRLHFWQIAVEMADAKPMTGVGLNGFLRSYESYNTNTEFMGERAAHSVWFGILGDLGYPGLILFVGNVVMAFWSCWRISWLARKQPALRDLKIFANALISSLVVYVVSGSFLSYQYNEMAWHLFGLATALHLVAIRETAELRKAPAEKFAA